MTAESDTTPAIARSKSVVKWAVRPVIRPVWERLHALAVRLDGVELGAVVLDNRARVVEDGLDALRMRSDTSERRLEALERRVTEVGVRADRVDACEQRLVALEQHAARLEEALGVAATSASRIDEVLDVISAQHALSRQSRRQLDALLEEFQAFVPEARRRLEDLLAWKSTFAGSRDASLD